MSSNPFKLMSKNFPTSTVSVTNARLIVVGFYVIMVKEILPIYKIKNYLQRLTNSFFFIPSLVISTSILLAFLLIGAEYYFKDVVDIDPLFFVVSPDAARSILSTIAATYMTALSFAFPITLVAFQLSSQQYSPRALSEFIQDGKTQFVLGYTFGVYVYSLVVLRSIRVSSSTEVADFVPELALLAALLLAIAGTFILIYFLRHVAQKLQATNLLDSMHTQLLKQIDVLYPDSVGQKIERDVNPQAIINTIKSSGKSLQIRSKKAGFVTNVHEDNLQKLDLKNAKWIWIKVKLGDFVTNKQVIAEVDNYTGKEQEISSKIRDSITLAPHKSSNKNLLFNFEQLVDLGLKTISSGDPSTTVYAINYVVDGLIRLGNKEFPSVERSIEKSKTKLLVSRHRWEDYIQSSLDSIRIMSMQNPIVLSNFIDRMKVLLENLPNNFRSNAVINQLLKIEAHLLQESTKLPNKEIMLSNVREIQRQNVLPNI